MKKENAGNYPALSGICNAAHNIGQFAIVQINLA